MKKATILLAVLLIISGLSFLGCAQNGEGDSAQTHPADYDASGAWSLQGTNYTSGSCLDVAEEVMEKMTNWQGTITQTGEKTWTYDGNDVDGRINGSRYTGVIEEEGIDIDGQPVDVYVDMSFNVAEDEETGLKLSGSLEFTVVVYFNTCEGCKEVSETCYFTVYFSGTQIPEIAEDADSLIDLAEAATIAAGLVDDPTEGQENN